MPAGIWGINLLHNFHELSCAVLLWHPSATLRRAPGGNYMCGGAGVTGNVYFRSNQIQVSYEYPATI